MSSSSDFTRVLKLRVRSWHTFECRGTLIHILLWLCGQAIVHLYNKNGVDKHMFFLHNLSWSSKPNVCLNFSICEEPLGFICICKVMCRCHWAAFSSGSSIRGGHFYSHSGHWQSSFPCSYMTYGPGFLLSASQRLFLAPRGCLQFSATWSSP